MNISVDDLKILNHFNVGGDTFNTGGKLYRYNDDILYKVVGEYFFVDEVERNVDLQIKEHICNTPYIYDKLCINNDFIGYSMEYLKNSFTFRRAIYLHVDFDVSVNVVKDIYKVIKHLHSRNILLGDIHMDNYMINNKGCGYVVDLDYMLFPDDLYKFQDLYYIKLKSDSKIIRVNDKRTDNIKSMICSLSLIFGMDLERLCIKNHELDIENMYYKYIKPLGIGELNAYIECIINGENVCYFDEFLVNNYICFKCNGLVKGKKKQYR